MLLPRMTWLSRLEVLIPFRLRTRLGYTHGNSGFCRLRACRGDNREQDTTVNFWVMRVDFPSRGVYTLHISS